MAAKLVLNYKEKKFASKTISKLQVADNVYENTTDYIFNVKIENKNDKGYVIRIDVINFKQTAVDFTSELLADLGKVNKKIIFQADSHCNMLHVINKEEIIDTWQSVFLELKLKYKTNSKAIDVLKHFDKQLKESTHAIEEVMRNRGFYDMILNGMIARDFSAEFEIEKSISNFINEKPLPFIVKDHVFETPVIGTETQKWIRAKGILDDNKFDRDYLRQNIRRITGNAIFPVKPDFEYQEAFRINNKDEIIEARQELRFLVEGYYYSATKNIMKELIV
jgi:hypothetical protein